MDTHAQTTEMLAKIRDEFLDGPDCAAFWAGKGIKYDLIVGFVRRVTASTRANAVESQAAMLVGMVYGALMEEAISDPSFGLKVAPLRDPQRVAVQRDPRGERDR